MPMPLTISCRNAELSASADIDSLEDDADASLDRARQRWVEICQEAVLQRDTSMGMLSEEINRLLSRDDSRT
jgi:vacuolar-type H+-ATPase subunit H